MEANELSSLIVALGLVDAKLLAADVDRGDILVVPFVPETRVPGLEQPIILTSGDKPL